MMSRHYSEDQLETWRRTWKKKFSNPDAFLRHLEQQPTAKASLIDEQLFLSNLPPERVPNTWEQLTEMWNFVKERRPKALEIQHEPLTFADEQISAKVWVGLTLPLFKRDQKTCPMVFVTDRLVSFRPELAKIKKRGDNQYCFLVDSAQAVGILAKNNPEAAQVWQQKHPDWQDPGQVLVFNGDCGTVK